MLMYIDEIRVYAPANAKCKELAEWADERYSYCLTDERTLQRIYEEIRERMAALDEKYPRMRRTTLDINKVNGSMMKIYANIESKTDKNVVFIMTVRRAEVRYLWSDGRNMPVYYGRQEEEEYRRACERRKGGRQ